jgi:hypothetical protein
MRLDPDERHILSYGKPSWPSFSERFYARTPVSRDRLIQLLDNVSAAARNMLNKNHMRPEDFVRRAELIDAAREICDAELRPISEDKES